MPENNQPEELETVINNTAPSEDETLANGEITNKMGQLWKHSIQLSMVNQDILKDKIFQAAIGRGITKSDQKVKPKQTRNWMQQKNSSSNSQQ